MRKIAMIGLVVLSVAAVGCSKKTEEHANENMSAPAPAQQAAPESAPMQGMDMNKPAEPAPGAAPAPAPGEAPAGQPQGGQAPAPAAPASGK